MRIKLGDLVLCVDPPSAKDIDTVYVVYDLAGTCRGGPNRSCFKCTKENSNYFISLKRLDGSIRTNLGLYACRFVPLKNKNDY